MTRVEMDNLKTQVRQLQEALLTTAEKVKENTVKVVPCFLQA